MERHAGLETLPVGLRLAVTIGVFDGVHRGHLAVLRALMHAARAARAAPVAVTFEPHPELVLRGAVPPLLCDAEERAALLAAAGVAHLVVQPFDRAFAALSAEAFVERLGAGRDLAALVMTPESAFGRGRAGTAATMAALGALRGFRVVEIASLRSGAALISSGRIRSLLAEGRLAAAARLLGRRPAVTGKVVRGDGRGRELRYPTANLAFDAPVALPRDGIYAVRVGWGGPHPLAPQRQADGVASLGVRPTFGIGDRVLEVHLFDFDEELYGQRLRVEFVRRQRGERRFQNAAALVAQMDLDAARARRTLAATAPAPSRAR
ncbi:MAG: FMN adenylyltransferase, riboflavin kinase, riboflavin kinase / FMN adenylyltransferase [Chloroflexi bacterium CSP1-4]|nr:MAG: FMN adenylyltransferase, riboflavin kinase, riboflavin kinase / FMN adenylyltransferase [Chloroflexi bacterium CSP1-4]